MVNADTDTEAEERNGRLSRFFLRYPRFAGALVTATGILIVGIDLATIGGLQGAPSISWERDVWTGVIVDAVILALGIAALVGRRMWWRPLVVLLLIAIGAVLFVLWGWNHPRRQFVRDYEVTDDAGLIMYVITMTFSVALLLAGLGCCFWDAAACPGYAASPTSERGALVPVGARVTRVDCSSSALWP